MRTVVSVHRKEARKLHVIGPVVRHPRLTQDLPSESALKRGVLVGVIPSQELGFGPQYLERVSRCPGPENRTAALQVIRDVLHLVVRIVTKAQAQKEQVGRPQ